MANESYLSAVRKLDNQYKFDQPYPNLAPQPNIFQGANPYAPAPEVKKEEPSPTENKGEKIDLAPMGEKVEQAMEQKPGKSGLSQAASLGGDALILYGDPSMKAVGLGLKVASGIAEGKAAQKQQKEMNEYNAKVAEINARQQAWENLSRLGQGMKA